MNNVLTRRHFLKASALTSGGLMLEITLSGAALRRSARNPGWFERTQRLGTNFILGRDYDLLLGA